MKSIVASIICLFSSVFLAHADPVTKLDGHFSSWENVPDLIDSITKDSYREPLKKLHQLTAIKLGYPQHASCLSEEEHKLSILHAKKRWQQWWKDGGAKIAQDKKANAKVDEKAFQQAWKFLGMKAKLPKEILPVWIPEEWSLTLTFSNGDYGGKVSEVWLIERKAKVATLMKLKGFYGKKGWEVTLSKYQLLTRKSADLTLRTICYINQYAPYEVQGADSQMKGLYYPHSAMRLEMLEKGEQYLVWNTHGYDFQKAKTRMGWGASGRTLYFLKTNFRDTRKWNKIDNPGSEELAPLRYFLSCCKPYHDSSALDVSKFLLKNGGVDDYKALIHWAEKQKAATNPQMTWLQCVSDFGAGGKENVINSTRAGLERTLKGLREMGDGLEKQDLKLDRKKELELAEYVKNMLLLEKKEKYDKLMNYPQPLRDLIIADNHPNDSDLVHLSTAVQKIRNNPDPILFQQLAGEQHEGTLQMSSLLNHILLNEYDVLDLKPWGVKQEKVAVNACIDALPLANQNAKGDLLETILKLNGGGKIALQTKSGGISLEVKFTKDGTSISSGGTANGLTMKQAQKKLRELYQQSKLERDNK